MPSKRSSSNNMINNNLNASFRGKNNAATHPLKKNSTKSMQGAGLLVSKPDVD